MNFGARTSAPIIRGQQPTLGGQGTSALPGDQYFSRRPTTTFGGQSNPVRPAQFSVDSNGNPANGQPNGNFSAPAFGEQPFGTPPGQVFRQPGTGLGQPGVSNQPALPFGAAGTTVSQPPFNIPSPIVDPNYIEFQPIDIDVLLEEAQTGRLMFGIGVNSDAGVIGNIVIDEQNFDITRWPRSFRDFTSGAFRGAGQRFRLEALPGTQVQRYTASFSDPYIFNSPFSLSLSGFYYDRFFVDWDEQRVGGSLGFGYSFPERPDLSTSVNFRYETIDIFNPRVPTPQALTEVVGQNDLMSVRFQVSHDRRDSAYLPTEGHLIRLSFEQAFGSFTYPKFEGDYRKYFVTRERPDRTGRHVLGLSLKIGAAGDDTPLYEHFFAGGFSTIRGFDFRGASPTAGAGNVVVGGEFQVLSSAEYRFPLTADDNLYGSFFLDVGTVEESSSIAFSDVRVTPGFELRVNIPALGPIPLAIGVGVPIQHEVGDDLRPFHFFVGISR
jgi:outer membrane protein insertion porin family